MKTTLTRIGLAALSRVFGLRAVIVMPETQSAEKKDAVRALGAELVEVPAVPYANPNNVSQACKVTGFPERVSTASKSSMKRAANRPCKRSAGRSLSSRTASL